jgi:uncharacterized protein YidB (DUF937 family)
LLLGLLAVAGYQNRDKLGAAINKMQVPGADPSSGTGLGGILDGIGAGGLANGLGDLLKSFQNAGHGDVADSWIRPGVPTQPVTAEQVSRAVGEENLSELSQRLGISRDELLQRLAGAIPAGVDQLTPEGRMPNDEDVRKALLPGV